MAAYSQLAEIRQKLQQSRQETLRHLQHLDEQQASYRFRPDAWSIKDHIAHLTALEAAVIHFAERILTEEAPIFENNSTFDQDVWNNRVVAEHAQDSWAETGLALDKTRQALYALLDRLPEEALNRVGSHPVWGSPVTLASVLRVPYRHERSHRDEIIILSVLQENSHS
jgi:hypothetical protein